eukprot:TRINITY_DN495_c0_g1_i5.p2 TRINITY_DN495_c0_g1~~TRINITY_DN495_c0_g1_i5.p2  ORF type:complete len:130 (-),score=69.06 TRINITY_DN495_c0_g1_i5:471-836(-)
MEAVVSTQSTWKQWYQRRVHGECSDISCPRSVSTMKLFLATLTVLAAQAMAKTSYDGYQVLRTSALTPEASAMLRELQLTTNSIDFWREPATGMSTDINTPPELLAGLKEMLASEGGEVST